jgi:hypothetical protein
VILLLRTDRRGRVLAVAAGGGGLARSVAAGGTLAPLVADSGAAPLFDFLLALRRGGAVAWDVPAAVATGAGLLHFAGATAGEASWIAAATSRRDLAAGWRKLAGGVDPPLEPRPPEEALRRVEALLAEAAGLEAEPAAGAGEVARLERRLAEKERENAELRARLARLEAEGGREG